MNRSQTESFVAGACAGLIVGAAVALLLAPRSGRRVRRIIRNAAEDAVEIVRSNAGTAIDRLTDRVTAIR